MIKIKYSDKSINNILVKNQIIFVLLVFFLSCTNNKLSKRSHQSFLYDCSVVAIKEVVDGDTVIACDYNKFKQRKNVPLEELLVEYNIIKLDNENEDGLFGNRLAGHIIGEKYIAVFQYRQTPLKLFDKEGNYIRTIGRYGQGPGEYTVINTV